MKIKYTDNKQKIFAPLKDQYLEARPEEEVRQEFIYKINQ